MESNQRRKTEMDNIEKARNYPTLWWFFLGITPIDELNELIEAALKLENKRGPKVQINRPLIRSLLQDSLIPSEPEDRQEGIVASIRAEGVGAQLTIIQKAEVQMDDGVRKVIITHNVNGSTISTRVHYIPN